MTCDNCSNCDLPSVIRQPDQPPPRGLASEMLGCLWLVPRRWLLSRGVFSLFSLGLNLPQPGFQKVKPPIS
jgi:hypothetical protein